ncbi:MAG: YhbY family RNA-binding protein [Candidatus Bathyarchaeota archaeon]|nr:YhbY family RNA-binding protein [Candidatus Bathyarchaeota archaeon]
MRRKDLSKTPHLKPTAHIGKKGVTVAQVKEIAKQLETRRRVKIKVLKSALIEGSVEDIAQKIARETGSKIVQIIGHTFTLHKPKKRTSQLNIRSER